MSAATNRQIAEWLGWQAVDPRSVSPYKWLSPSMGVQEELPGYTTDLNACAEFGPALRERQLANDYSDCLYEVLPSGVQQWEATAKQRCAAMVKVMDEEDTRNG